MESLSRRELMATAAVAASGWVLAGDAGARAQPSLRQLARSVRGPVMTPHSSAALVFNERYAGIRPLAVVQATSAADVQACVRWAARRGVKIAARSGGHSYGGYSTARDGLVVDLRRLDRVSLSGRTVTAGPGTTLIELYGKLSRRGATVPGGSCPTVGLGGLALGGGMGLAGRKLGLTCDNVTALQVVTADGRVRRCDADTNADLFWACRGGGGGNFGIVTGLQLRAHRVSRATWFFVSWPWSRAGEALAAWQQLAPDAPSDLTSIFTLASTRRVSASGQWFGSEASLRRLLRPLTRVAGASLSAGTTSYLGLMERWAGCSGQSVARCGAFSPMRFDAGSDYVARPLSVAGRRAAIAQAAKRGGTLLLDSYGGAINRVKPGATAFVHRDQLFSIQYFSASARGDWVQGARRAMRPYVSGQAYQNYIDPQLRDWQRAYYGSNLDRLRAVKAAVDPDRLFRFAQGIRPG